MAEDDQPAIARPGPRSGELHRRVVWMLTAALVPVVTALVLGAVALWPHGEIDTETLQGVTGDVKEPPTSPHARIG